MEIEQIRNLLQGQDEMGSAVIATHELQSKCRGCSLRADSDPEKAASGASGGCGHLARNHAILRTFLVEYHVLLSEEGGRRVDD